MNVKIARPPMFAEIDAAFNIADQQVIFAWGDTIYNPKNVPIDAELMAHESVHGERQGDDPESWWLRYIADRDFRLAEEIPAHQVQYRRFCENPNNKRNSRRLYLHHVAKCLSAPLYGRLITYDDARKVVRSASPFPSASG